MVRLRDARPRKVAVSVRLDERVLSWLRSKRDGHLTRINDILTNLMEAEQRTRPGRLATAFHGGTLGPSVRRFGRARRLPIKPKLSWIG
jgi:BrnA antitoxin of type II toxin-antitoxin system